MLLYRHHDSLGVSQAAALLGVSRSTAHRLMTTLARHDFVVQDPATRSYSEIQLNSSGSLKRLMPVARRAIVSSSPSVCRA